MSCSKITVSSRPIAKPPLNCTHWISLVSFVRMKLLPILSFRRAFSKSFMRFVDFFQITSNRSARKLTGWTHFAFLSRAFCRLASINICYSLDFPFEMNMENIVDVDVWGKMAMKQIVWNCLFWLVSFVVIFRPGHENVIVKNRFVLSVFVFCLSEKADDMEQIVAMKILLFDIPRNRKIMIFWYFFIFLAEFLVSPIFAKASIRGCVQKWKWLQ